MKLIKTLIYILTLPFRESEIKKLKDEGVIK